MGQVLTPNHLDYYDYCLPDNLIANMPTNNRTDSRLMQVSKKSCDIEHHKFADLIKLINPNDLLILNESKVIPARLFGIKRTGGKIEVLIERINSDNSILAQVKSSKSLKPGQFIYIEQNLSATEDIDYDNCEFVLEVLSKDGMFYKLDLANNLNKSKNIHDLLDKYGHMPLPPYIKRADQAFDKTRYQTVYAKNLGSVAAPTAGLHFDEKLISNLKDKGVNFAKVTLHVGAGTFSPVRTDDITMHKMHSEWVECDQDVCDKIKETKLNGGRVIAVGTTSIRVLESAFRFKQNSQNQVSEIKPFNGNTDIFIYPGFEFKIVDALITNFHLPKSSLLMLVSAFSSCEIIKKAYTEAIAKGYRFFSYGDAMFLG